MLNVKLKGMATTGDNAQIPRGWDCVSSCDKITFAAGTKGTQDKKLPWVTQVAFSNCKGGRGGQVLTVAGDREWRLTPVNSEDREQTTEQRTDEGD